MIGFHLRPLEGGERWIPLPDLNSARDASESLFEEACQAITDEHSKRPKGGAETREWVQTVCYDCLKLLHCNQYAYLLEERISRLGRAQRGTTQVNPFQRGLLAIYAHKPDLMDEGDRSYFGKRLWYAYRHYVPTCFLRGFLHQVWSVRAEQKVDAGDIEPEFAVWVRLQRVADERPRLRGKYPKDLERDVRGFKDILPAIKEVEERRSSLRAKRADLLDEEFDG